MFTVLGVQRGLGVDSHLEVLRHCGEVRLHTSQRAVPCCSVQLQRVVQRVAATDTWHDWQPKKCATYRWIDVIAATASASVCVACDPTRPSTPEPECM